ncbi:MAG: bifunctional glutamate N-acetyltransferase/amino-acid acetyltransferase ArgJ [Actinobacteria bacterium]|nr:bifunctional glutamate N-acetyltransferase/amino-acid acetyltransferase ArgJ [Actinomycetota bacterium]
MAFKVVPGGITTPQGFQASGVACGVKLSGKPDLALIYSKSDASAAGVFTKNRLTAPPVILSKNNLGSGSARAIVVNSGNANACTGKQGYADAVLMAETTARSLGICADDVVVASTGVIGVPLPVKKIEKGIVKAASLLSDVGSPDAATAILTTDTFTKEYAVEVELSGGSARIGGIAKGSGMVAPNMATMLAFIATDAAIHQVDLKKLLSSVTERTFNSITVDGDTSTNDMVVAMANGASGVAVDHGELPLFREAFEAVAAELARMIVRDGEGATKLIEVKVTGAKDERDAKVAALAVANSNLVKTAMFGGDPNWGRIAAAAGYSGASLDPNALEITIGGVETVERGMPLPFDERTALEALSKSEVSVFVDLGVGSASATVWTCDFSYDYVRINSEYRT